MSGELGRVRGWDVATGSRDFVVTLPNFSTSPFWADRAVRTFAVHGRDRSDNVIAVYDAGASARQARLYKADSYTTRLVVHFAGGEWMAYNSFGEWTASPLGHDMAGTTTGRDDSPGTVPRFDPAALDRRRPDLMAARLKKVYEPD